MTYELNISEKPSHLHCVVIGQNSKENVIRYMEEILRECEARGSFRILIEERLEGPRLKMMDVFEIVTRVSERDKPRLQTIAYVDVNAEGDLMKFAETVAVNRMAPVKLFTTVAEAEKWLQDNQ